MWGIILSPMLTLALLAGEGTDPYVVREGGRMALTHPIEIKEEQYGAAGTNVSHWVVSPAGAWQYSEGLMARGKFVAGTEKSSRGQLTQTELATLAKELAAQDLVSMANGEKSKLSPAAPHRYTISFGGKKAVLAGVKARSGESRAQNIRESFPPRSVESAAPPMSSRFARIVEVIESMTGPRTSGS